MSDLAYWLLSAFVVLTLAVAVCSSIVLIVVLVTA